MQLFLENANNSEKAVYPISFTILTQNGYLTVPIEEVAKKS